MSVETVKVRWRRGDYVSSLPRALAHRLEREGAVEFVTESEEPAKAETEETEEQPKPRRRRFKKAEEATAPVPDAETAIDPE